MSNPVSIKLSDSRFGLITYANGTYTMTGEWAASPPSLHINGTEYGFNGSVSGSTITMTDANVAALIGASPVQTMGFQFLSSVGYVIGAFVPNASTMITPVSATASSAPPGYPDYAPPASIDENSQTFWISGDGTPATIYDGSGTYIGSNGEGEWVQVDLGSAKVVKGYALQGRGVYRPVACKVYGTNDGISFQHLSTNTMSMTDWWKSYGFGFTNTTAYRYYRFVFTQSDGNQIWLADLKLTA